MVKQRLAGNLADSASFEPHETGNQLGFRKAARSVAQTIVEAA
jgi:hypothetical protein